MKAIACARESPWPPFSLPNRLWACHQSLGFGLADLAKPQSQTRQDDKWKDDCRDDSPANLDYLHLVRLNHLFDDGKADTGYKTTENRND